MINTQSSPSVITANIACFMAMLMWAVGFPSGEILLETWGAISLLSIRILIAVCLLMISWIVAEGMPTVLAAPWGRGLTVGGIGFGFGAILLLVGQKMSDPVTPAIVASMMPIAGASIEVVLDKRKLHLQLLGGIMNGKWIENWGILYLGHKNGVWGWYQSADERRESKYSGQIKNFEPSGQGTYTFYWGGKFEGEFIMGNGGMGQDTTKMEKSYGSLRMGEK